MMPQRERGQGWDRMIRKLWLFAQYFQSKNGSRVLHKSMVRDESKDFWHAEYC